MKTFKFLILFLQGGKTHYRYQFYRIRTSIVHQVGYLFYPEFSILGQKYQSSPSISFSQNKKSIFPEIKRSIEPLNVRDSLKEKRSELRSSDNKLLVRSFKRQKDLKLKRFSVSVKSRSALHSPSDRHRSDLHENKVFSLQETSVAPTFYQRSIEMERQEKLSQELGEEEQLFQNIESNISTSVLELQYLQTTAGILESQAKLIVALIEAIEKTEEVNYRQETLESTMKPIFSEALPDKPKLKASTLNESITRKSELLWRKHNGTSTDYKKRNLSAQSVKEFNSYSVHELKKGHSRGKIDQLSVNQSQNHLPKLVAVTTSQKIIVHSGLKSKPRRTQTAYQEKIPALVTKKGTTGRYNTPQRRDSTDSTAINPSDSKVEKVSSANKQKSPPILVIPENKNSSSRNSSLKGEVNSNSNRGSITSKSPRQKDQLPTIQVINHKDPVDQPNREPLTKKPTDNKNTNFLSPNNSPRKSDKLDKSMKKPPARSGSGMLEVMMQLIDLSMQEIAERRSLHNQFSLNQHPHKPSHYLTKDDMNDQKGGSNTNLVTGQRRGSLSIENNAQLKPKGMVFVPLALKFLQNMNRMRGDRGSSSFQQSNSLDFDMESYMNISNLDDIENELLRVQTLCRQNSANSMDDFWREWTDLNKHQSAINPSNPLKSPQKEEKSILKKVNFAKEEDELEVAKTIRDQKNNNAEIKKIEGFDKVLQVGMTDPQLEMETTNKINKRELSDVNKVPPIERKRSGNHGNEPSMAEPKNMETTKASVHPPPKIIKVEHHIVERRHTQMPALRSSSSSPLKQERKKDLSKTIIKNDKKFFGPTKIQIETSALNVRDPEHVKRITEVSESESERDLPPYQSLDSSQKPSLDEHPAPFQKPIQPQLDFSPKNSDTITSPIQNPTTYTQNKQLKPHGGNLSDNSSYIQFIDDNTLECGSPYSMLRSPAILSKKDLIREGQSNVILRSYGDGSSNKEGTFDELVRANDNPQSLVSLGRRGENQSSTDKETYYPVLLEKSIEETPKLVTENISSPTLSPLHRNDLERSTTEKLLRSIDSED